MSNKNQNNNKQKPDVKKEDDGTNDLLNELNQGGTGPEQGKDSPHVDESTEASNPANIESIEDEAKESFAKIASRKLQLLTIGFILQTVDGLDSHYSLGTGEESFDVTIDELSNLTNEEWDNVIDCAIECRDEDKQNDSHVGATEENGAIAETVDENEGYPVYQNDDPTKAKANHEERVAKFGKGYVVATKGKFQRVWTATAWGQMMGENPWKEAVAMAPEMLAAMKGKK